MTWIFTEWTREPDVYKAANIFRHHLLNNAKLKPELVARLDLGSTEEHRFYKKPGIDWASPFSVILRGMYLR